MSDRCPVCNQEYENVKVKKTNQSIRAADLEFSVREDYTMCKQKKDTNSHYDQIKVYIHSP